MIEVQSPEDEGRSFVEFRRKIRSAEVLSATLQRLLQTLHFNGRLSVIVQNGQVLKSGYEEGYFKQRESGVATRLQ
ncbi:MAG TPA: hypothetical protein VJX69_07630 [Terriglobales bacterium]|nr:hypothetical protein [Terriglobales bacterium]